MKMMMMTTTTEELQAEPFHAVQSLKSSINEHEICTALKRDCTEEKKCFI